MSARGKGAFLDRLPSEDEIKSARQLESIVASQVEEDGSTKLSFALEEGGVQTVGLTPLLTKSLLEVLGLVSGGRGFFLTPVTGQLTTQQAADLLNASRPFLVKLLEEGEIPFVKIGRHRRIRADDLHAYMARRDASRSRALDCLARVDQKEGNL